MRINKIKIFCVLIALFVLTLPLRAIDFEIGAMYNQGKTNRLVTLSQPYKEGKLNLRLKAEKIENSLLDFQAICAYPLSKGYSLSAVEKINVDPSFEPIQYTTSIGIGKTIGKGDISINEAISFKAYSNKKSYSTLIGSSYKLGGKAKLCLTIIIPSATPNKQAFKGTIIYSLK
ncbi:MAG: hypothetical protein PHE59_03705 [Patescibacteria group bacterium]|nr:hypothetical protein [Patescibacteria group bacterium]MDD5164758.1 hypothetical protein [Patescibacteria group bacterium]MDD5534426.1 hypothetical protein [Patescibacteria group bacterium]